LAGSEGPGGEEGDVVIAPGSGASMRAEIGDATWMGGGAYAPAATGGRRSSRRRGFKKRNLVAQIYFWTHFSSASGPKTYVKFSVCTT